MDVLSVVLLMFTVAFSTGRNILSKSISGSPFGSSGFFRAQTMTFLFGSLVLAVTGVSGLGNVSSLTLLYAFIYGCLLISAQWCYTSALKNGNTGICSTVYSLGFIIPTLSGALFWQEDLTGMNLLGIACVIPAVLISGKKGKKAADKVSAGNNKFIVPLVAAMLSSGGLGVMQKVQQKSAFADQRAVFVWIAFLFACAASLTGYVCTKKKDEIILKNGTGKGLYLSGGIGVCFASSNLLNTTLAGRMDSAVFFPVNNISVILVSLLLGVVIFKERIGKKELTVLGLGILSILLLCG